MLEPKKLSFKKTLYPMILLPVLLAACGGNTGASKAEEPATQSRLLLGTVCRITLYAGVSDEAFQAAFQRIAEIEKAMSVNLPDSEVSIINEAAGTGEWTQVSQDTFTVVEKALEIAGMSSGGFDPSVGPLVKLWGVGTENARIP
ncbi:MAG: FAD:protein FMN transferase, partial [Spirochaetales bacterium]|nr:FAD:protein FMN transferase [Spirochaetales bacterium]